MLRIKKLNSNSVALIERSSYSTTFIAPLKSAPNASKTH
jgi:hypothetical protein